MTNIKVLTVNVDPAKQGAVGAALGELKCEVVPHEAVSGLLFQTRPGDPAVVLLRLPSPPEEALSQLWRVRKLNPWLPIVALLNPEASATGLSLLRDEIVDQIAGPTNAAAVFSALRSALAARKLLDEKADCARRLKELKAEQSRNRRQAAELEDSYTATLENLMTALDIRDVETFGHSLTVAKYSCALAGILDIRDEKQLDSIRKGALLHDIGKIAIPDSILKKPGRLSPTEWEKVKLHPALGYGLIKEIKLLREVGNIILCHHERYDGTGYPKGLKGESIPREARIFALADALDAITSHRPYKKERDFRAARKDIIGNRGRQFDPEVVDAFCSMKPEEWERIRYETTKFLPAMETFSQLYSHPAAPLKE